MSERSGGRERSRASGRVSGASERTSEWPSTYVSILVCYRPQCRGLASSPRPAGRFPRFVLSSSATRRKRDHVGPPSVLRSLLDPLALRLTRPHSPALVHFCLYLLHPHDPCHSHQPHHHPPSAVLRRRGLDAAWETRGAGGGAQG